MKKANKVLGLVLFVSIMLAGCGGDSGDENPGNGSDTTGIWDSSAWDNSAWGS